MLHLKPLPLIRMCFYGWVLSFLLAGSFCSSGQPDGYFKNPVRKGMYPDPSVCRVGQDYYLVNSSFEYFPGLPVSHSRDLIHWETIGHALSRPSQLFLDSTIQKSDGIWAPTIRYHEGIFYIVYTLASDRSTRFRNYVVTAQKPEGPWSEPVLLTDEKVQGIDPSLFFDEGGKCWFTMNYPKKGAVHPRQNVIRMVEFDYRNLRLAKDTAYDLWDGFLKEFSIMEGAHLYKKDGMYYLLAAEGGTGTGHCVTLATSKSLFGPYQGVWKNPVLTHRNLPEDHPITSTGHADLVDTPSGEWWMVLLGVRPYGPNLYNTGRETFLVPVRWEDNWLFVNNENGRVNLLEKKPDLPEGPNPKDSFREDFENPQISPDWNGIRTPSGSFYSLSARKGYLRLKLLPGQLNRPEHCSFLGKRITGTHFEIQTKIDFRAKSAGEQAGLVLIQNFRWNFKMVLEGVGPERKICLYETNNGVERLVASNPVGAKEVTLKVESNGPLCHFYFSEIPGTWVPLALDQNGKILSTAKAGGFVGAYAGFYASSNGMRSGNTLDADWFEIKDLDP
jgi:xylan 1,4-beta-xylosidase